MYSPIQLYFIRRTHVKSKTKKGTKEDLRGHLSTKCHLIVNSSSFNSQPLPLTIIVNVVNYWLYLSLTASTCQLLALLVNYWPCLSTAGSTCQLLALPVNNWLYLSTTGFTCQLLALPVNYWLYLSITVIVDSYNMYTNEFDT